MLMVRKNFVSTMLIFFGAGMVLIGCERSATTPRHSVDDETSSNQLAQEYSQAVPEVLQNLDVSDDDTLICNPGCALQNDTLGKPIVPNWCEAWSPITPTCVRFKEKTYCVGMWEGAARSVNEVTDNGTVFHLDENPAKTRERAQKDSTYFACTRINRQKFATGDGLYDLKPDLPGAPNSMSCSPGCIYDTESTSRDFGNKPSWCLRAQNSGCSANLAASCTDPKPLNLCYGIKPVEK
ncbi:MAG: hypothetical protein AAF936_07370 [Pseudomonadota bacterium]